MAYEVGRLDPVYRAREKQESRERDLYRLRVGQVSQQELAHENDFFANLDLPRFRLASIGGRLLSQGAQIRQR